MTLTVEEQETIIRIDRGGQVAQIYTSDTQRMQKFDKLVKEGEEWRLVREDEVSKEYECPVEFIRFKAKRRKKTELTPEQKDMLRARMAILRQKSR